jgi:hypothetical protein
MTDMQKSDGQILRTDVKGRVRTPAQRRESLLDEFERSGLTGPKFAELAGIKYQTFAAWALRRRKRVATQSPVKPQEQVRWLEAVVEQAQKSDSQNQGVLVLQLPGGVRAEISDLKQAALAGALVRALAQSC